MKLSSLANTRASNFNAVIQMGLYNIFTCCLYWLYCLPTDSHRLTCLPRYSLELWKGFPRLLSRAARCQGLQSQRNPRGSHTSMVCSRHKGRSGSGVSRKDEFWETHYRIIRTTLYRTVMLVCICIYKYNCRKVNRKAVLHNKAPHSN